MLKLYQNIKRLREELGLSQEALAKLTGYTDRSSITKIEKGQVDLQQSKIELFAKALGTTPSDLVGWDDQEQEPPSAPDSLTVTGLEKDIIIEYRRSDDIAQAIVLRALDLDMPVEKEESDAG
ncbi:MAG: helix-turn-helix domain-containing protein [Lachnospiraceae bacterium]|nr:helix-turn-helix domain-containing protein [Lachnospiraceae bacterium]